MCIEGAVASNFDRKRREAVLQQHQLKQQLYLRKLQNHNHVGLGFGFFLLLCTESGSLASMRAFTRADVFFLGTDATRAVSAASHRPRGAADLGSDSRG